MVNPAFGYIDPGSGSALISILFGFLVAIVVTIKTYWYKLKNFLKFSKFKKIKSSSSKDNPYKNNNE